MKQEADLQQRTWHDYMPVLAILLSVAGLLWAAAQAAGQLDDHTRRIVLLETGAMAMRDMDRVNAERLARIEENIEYLVAEQRR